MATIAQLRELARHAVNGTAPETFSVDNVNEAFRDTLKEFAGDINQFMKNRYDLYAIIIENADEFVPNKVIAAMSPFAEVKVVPQGQKALFKTGTLGKNRARKFLTQVGLSGVYETFRLDNSSFELGGHAVGGAATIDFERMLDGAEIMSDVMEIITEGMVDSVYGEVQKALRAAVNASDRPEANRVIHNMFDAQKMFNLITVVKAYGSDAVIFAPPEFVGAMGPDAIVPVSVAGAQGIYHPDDIDAIHKTGYINLFRGTPIVQIPQSFVDESNTTTWIDPQLAYVLPTGKQKVVKVVLEGKTQIYDFVNRDQSMEVHTYKKIGAAILTHYNWGVYQNTGITQTMDYPYGN